MIFLKKYFGSSLVCLSLLLSCSVNADIQVEDPWMRLLPPMSKMTAAYMKLVSNQDDRLISITSDIARIVEIHQSKMESGVMSMREVKSLRLPKDEMIELKPQAYHLMVMGLHSPLKDGDLHKFTLEFEQAGKLDIQIPVKNP